MQLEQIKKGNGKEKKQNPIAEVLVLNETTSLECYRNHKQKFWY